MLNQKKKKETDIMIDTNRLFREFKRTCEHGDWQLFLAERYNIPKDIFLFLREWHDSTKEVYAVFIMHHKYGFEKVFSSSKPDKYLVDYLTQKYNSIDQIIIPEIELIETGLEKKEALRRGRMIRANPAPYIRRKKIESLLEIIEE